MPKKGQTVSPEMRARISAALRGRPSANRGRAPSVETREKLAAANRGKKHSEETKAKMRASQALRPPMSAETKAKMSAAKMGRLASEETRRKMSDAKKGKPGNKPGLLARAATSARMRGVPWTDELRAKLSGLNSPHFGKGPRHKPRVPYKGMLMRSTWEVRFAEHCDARGVSWQYEPHRFTLGVCTYAPDFYLPDDDTYWEIKGWLDERSQTKARLFRELHPEKTLIVATKPVLRMIRCPVD